MFVEFLLVTIKTESSTDSLENPDYQGDIEAEKEGEGDAGGSISEICGQALELLPRPAPALAARLLRPTLRLPHQHRPVHRVYKHAQCQVG